MSICGEIENVEQEIRFIKMKLGTPEFYKLNKVELKEDLKEAQERLKKLESIK